MGIIAIMALTFIISKFLIDNITKMLCIADKSICRVVNYRGKAIPAIGGIVFVPILLIAVLLLLFLFPNNIYVYLRYLLLVLCMGFTGVVDDLAGDKEQKGFVKHFISTIGGGNMTTGFLKALAGLLVSCIVNFGTTKNLAEFLANVIIIALFANTINIFDLRPGRAVKVYLLFSLILLSATVASFDAAAPLIVLCIAAVLYIPHDLKEICMLGDTGANILGITLGYYSTLLLDLDKKLLLAAILVFINIISERISMTEIISRNRLLNYIDGLGRGQKNNK